MLALTAMIVVPGKPSVLSPGVYDGPVLLHDPCCSFSWEGEQVEFQVQPNPVFQVGKGWYCQGRPCKQSPETPEKKVLKVLTSYTKRQRCCQGLENFAIPNEETKGADPGRNRCGQCSMRLSLKIPPANSTVSPGGAHTTFLPLFLS